MKKVFILLFLVIVAFASPKMAFAQTQETASKSAIINYDLAYPGILPDNPFYKLKVLRDKISERLITNPAKKAEFYLLQADKGILAAAILVDKKEIKLAQETALKAENNMTLLTYELKKFTKKPDDSLFKKLKEASLKHQEVLSSLITRLPQSEQSTFITVLNFSKTNLQTIEKVEKRKFYILR